MGLSKSQKIEYIALLEEKKIRLAKTLAKRRYAAFYDWQEEFTAATKTHHESCLMAANQVGKTMTGVTIDSMHLTGDYPEEWSGFKFEFAPLCWGLGYSMEKTRDLIQTALFGKYTSADGFEGALVPKERIVSWESATGTPNAMRSVRVKHAGGGTSTMQFWSYSQGQHAIMGDVVDWFHIDEEPRDQSIRPQVLTRTINGDNALGGRGIYTFTPENGRTELVVKFMDDPSPSQFYMQKGWDDAPHMTKEKRERMLLGYPEHQRDMRTKGVPMLGHGRIYDLSDDFVICDEPPIPEHWFVINGMDFGDDHPQAHIQLVEDRDNSQFYVTRAYKARRTSANDAWGAVKPWADGIPTAWPHDGLQGEKGRHDAVQLKTHYENAGFNMLHSFATWPEGGNSVEAGLFQIIDLMRKGQFKICRGLHDAMAEFRQYHRDEKGKIAKSNDDILDAIRYAFMMRRYAQRVGDVGSQPKKINFSGWG